MGTPTFNMDAASALDVACTLLLPQRSGNHVIEVHPDTYQRWWSVRPRRSDKLVVLGAEVRTSADVAPGEARLSTPSSST